MDDTDETDMIHSNLISVKKNQKNRLMCVADMK